MYCRTEGSDLLSSSSVSIHSTTVWERQEGKGSGGRHCQIYKSLSGTIHSLLGYCNLHLSFGNEAWMCPVRYLKVLFAMEPNPSCWNFIVKARQYWQHCSPGNSGDSAVLPHLFSACSKQLLARSGSLSSWNMGKNITFTCSQPGTSRLWDKVSMGGQQENLRVSFWKICVSPNCFTKFPTWGLDTCTSALACKYASALVRKVLLHCDNDKQVT